MTDGLVVSTLAAALALAIGITTSVDREQPHTLQCQEVVINVDQRGNILAQCPVGTYIELVDSNVICRCNKPHSIESVEELPPTLVFPPDQILPNPVPKQRGDDRGIEL